MLYKISHDVAANTTQQNPDRQKLKITKGVIKGWYIFFPDETADVLHLQIRYHGHQILPINDTENLYGGGCLFDIEENVAVDKAPYELDIYSWNDDDSYPHEYNIHVNILREEAVELGGEIMGLWDKIKGWLGVD
jgi:hypothetical protein